MNTDIPRMAPQTIVASCAVLRQDIADDVERWDGAPLHAQNLSEVLAGILAQLDALTAMVGALARVVQEP